MSKQEIFYPWKPKAAWLTGMGTTIAANVATGIASIEAMREALRTSFVVARQALELSNSLNPFTLLEHPVQTVGQVALPMYVGVAETLPIPKDKPESRFARGMRELHFHLAMMTTSLAVPVLWTWGSRFADMLTYEVPWQSPNIGAEAAILLYAAVSLGLARSRYKRYDAVLASQAFKERNVQLHARPNVSHNDSYDIPYEGEGIFPSRPTSSQVADGYHNFIEQTRAQLEHRGFSPKDALEQTLLLAQAYLVNDGWYRADREAARAVEEVLASYEPTWENLGKSAPEDAERHARFQAARESAQEGQENMRGLIPNGPKY